VAVQFVSYPFHDETVLRAMRELEALCPFDEGKQLRLKHLETTYAHIAATKPQSPAAGDAATATQDQPDVSK